jgi:hypothetical protein
MIFAFNELQMVFDLGGINELKGLSGCHYNQNCSYIMAIVNLSEYLCCYLRSVNFAQMGAMIAFNPANA